MTKSELLRELKGLAQRTADVEQAELLCRLQNNEDFKVASNLIHSAAGRLQGVNLPGPKACPPV
ncbi:MAG TPA: hypothetical protein VNH18_10585 [Bryobacteraceae bacterium]|nr:hypothetical protein [Bryobacteraceae bacterium]